MIKCFIGNKLSQLYERHLEKALDMTYSPGEERAYEEYYTYGLGRFKWDIIYNNIKETVNYLDYSGCKTADQIGKMRWYYMYTQLYIRIFNETKGCFLTKIKLLLG